MKKYHLLVLMLLFSGFLQAAGLEIIPLRHQSAEDIIPVIRPLIGNNGVVTGSGYNLIVRASRQQIDEIKILLLELDRPAQQLIISVRQSRQTTQQTRRQGISGNLGDNNTRLQFGQPAHTRGLSAQVKNKDNALQAHINQQDTSLADDVSQQIRTLSGRPAYIAIGESRPIPQQQTIIHGNKITQTRNIQYHDNSSGFYVTARVNGTQVTLEISTQQQQAAGNRIKTSQLSTIIHGRLGQWIQLGSSNETSNKDSSNLFLNQQKETHDMSNVSVMITLAP